MSSHTITHLYEEYLEYRRIDLSPEQFTFLVTSYPVLLIISTDGTVDDKEWNHLKLRCNDLTDVWLQQVSDRDIVNDFKEMLMNEFKYLLMNFDLWERKFMKALKHHLKENPDLKHPILESIYLFASVSNGVCEKEEVMIEHLRKELHIEESL
jgi:thioredoxin-related protein